MVRDRAGALAIDVAKPRRHIDGTEDPARSGSKRLAQLQPELLDRPRREGKLVTVRPMRRKMDGRLISMFGKVRRFRAPSRRRLTKMTLSLISFNF
jgi:hypothetical protein